MSKTIPPKPPASASRPPALDRVLLALCRPGAFASASRDEPGTSVVVSAQSKGVSIAVLTAPAAVAATLESAGLAQWHQAGTGHVRRLLATDAGRARAARLLAGAEVPPFLAQHQPLVRETLERDATAVLLDAAESPLAWLARRKGRDGLALIDPVCLAAGERLRRDFTMAQMLPRVTSDWSGNAGGQSGGASAIHFSEAAAGARQRVDRALEAAGDEFAGLLLDVCGFLKGLEVVEGERGWPQRSARVVLVLALGRLAKHYGLAGEARGPRHSGGTRQWGAPDFRPALHAADAA